MAFYKLEQQIIDWHNARNLIEGSTDHQQFEKLERLRLDNPKYFNQLWGDL